MSNPFLSPVSLAGYDPQAAPRGTVAATPMIDNEADSGMVAMSDKLAAKFGTMADRAAQIEGRRAGAVAGSDPNFRPTGSTTLRGYMQDQAGIDTYTSNLNAQLGLDMAKTYQQFQDDPAGFAAASAKLRAQYTQNHVFPEIAGDFNKRFASLQETYQPRVLEGFQGAQKDRQRAAMITGLDGSETARSQVIAAGTDPAVIRRQVGYSVADDEARIDALVGSKAYTAEQGAKLKIAIRHQAATDVIMGEAGRLKSADDIDAYRQKLKQDFATGSSDLDADAYAKLDAGLTRLSKSVRTGDSQAASDLGKSLDELNEREANGYTPKASEWATLAMEAERVPGGRDLFQEARIKSAFAAKIAGQTPDASQAFIDGFKSRARAAPAAVYQAPANAADLPVGMQNNNPGNLKFFPATSGNYQGVVGPSKNLDQGDPQIVFATPEAGMRAAVQLARQKYSGGMTTADQIVAGPGGWTPGNKQAAANIAATMGLKPGDDLKLDTPDRMAAFMRAVVTQEHGPASQAYTDDFIRGTVEGGVAPPAPVGRIRANYASVGNMGDPLTPGWSAANIVPVQVGGATAQVNKQAAPAFQAFLEDLQAAGYPVKDVQGYNYRNIRGSSSLSQHAFGNAIDINPRDNPQGSATDAFGAIDVAALAAKHGLVWGGNWSGKTRDPMHFEWAGPGAGGAAEPGLAPADARVLEWGQKLVDKKRTALNQDPLGVAAGDMGINVAPLDFAGDVPKQISARVSQADAVADVSGRPATYFRPAEKEQLKGLLAKGGDTALQTVEALTAGAGAAAPKVLTELGTEAPELAQAAAVTLSTGDRSFAKGVADALAAKREKGAELPTVPAAIASDAEAQVFGNALGAMDLSKRQRVVAAARTWFAGQAAAQNIDPAGPDGTALYKSALQKAMLQTTVDGVDYGGVATFDGSNWYHRASGQVQVPSDVRADKFETLLDSLGDADLKGLPAPPVDSRGKPLAAADLMQKLPIRTPSGDYAFGARDPVSGKMTFVASAAGGPFVLPWASLAPVLRQRLPEAFR